MQTQETKNNQEICGAETSRGGTCQNVKDSCPWHNTDNPPENGRDPKFTEDRKQKMIEAAETGLPMKSIARAGGIDRSTLYRWLDEEDKQDFKDRLKQARNKAEQQLAVEARKKDPRYILTRSFKWDKPSADTVINNQMMQSQKQEQSTGDKLADLYKEKMEEQEDAAE